MEFAGPGSERHLHHSRHKDVTQLIPAADSARKKLRLDNNWLNNHFALFIKACCSVRNC